MRRARMGGPRPTPTTSIHLAIQEIYVRVSRKRRLGQLGTNLGELGTTALEQTFVAGFVDRHPGRTGGYPETNHA